MRDHEAEIDALGARVAAVGLGGFRFAEAFKEETGITFPLLVDGDRVAYDAVGLAKASLLDLLKKENRVARGRAKKAGHSQHGIGADPMQLGGSFVFAPGDRDLFAHVSDTFSDNADPQLWIDALEGG